MPLTPWAHEPQRGTLENPYLDEFIAVRGWDMDLLDKLDRLGNKSLARGREAVDSFIEWKMNRINLRGQYAYAIPNDEAIKLCVKYSPIVEVGAGNGYWAWLIMKHGGDVVAFDRFPGRYQETGQPFERMWIDVKHGGATRAAKYPDHTLMLCWPPYATPMANDALKAYRGRRVIYIGEWGGCTADSAFHKRLDREWEQTACVTLPMWDAMHDGLMVFEKEAAMITKFIEASNQQHGGMNWGKFMVARFEPTEWERRSALKGQGWLGLVDYCGWTPAHVLVFDLQTGEGAFFRPGGYPKADLEKHRIWVCPMFEPFLEWLYVQDLSNLDALPSNVSVDAPSSLSGHRRPGPSEQT